MEKLKSHIFFTAIVLVWGLLVLCNLVTPKESFSESENRVLASFPKFSFSALAEGRYTADITAYLSDHFAARSVWVGGYSVQNHALGRRETQQVYIGQNALLPQFLPPDEAVVESNIQGINAFSEKLGVPSYVMLVPSAATVQAERLPLFAPAIDEGTFLQGVTPRFAAAVTPVDSFAVLRAHFEEYIYYRTDHHWTSYGAFLGWGALSEAMGLGTPEIGDFTVEVISKHFLGTLHSKTGYPFIQADHMEVYQQGSVEKYEVFDGLQTHTYPGIFFEEFLAHKDQYSYFLGQMQPYATIYTTAQTSRKLLLFKDSYAHSMLPMMLGTFSEIRIVDLRFFTAEDYAAYLEAGRYTTVAFLYSADIFAHQRITAKLAA